MLTKKSWIYYILSKRKQMFSGGFFHHILQMHLDCLLLSLIEESMALRHGRNQYTLLV